MNGSYTIPNLENQGKNVGTINLPYLYQITSGQQQGKSLIFHFQIGKKYFRYHLKNLSSEKLNLACKDRSCQAKALLFLPKASGLIIEHSIRPTGKGRVSKSYKLNFEDLRLRNLDEYIVLTKDSPPHTCQSKPLTLGAQYDFRETHCKEGLILKKFQGREVLARSNLVNTYGIQTAAAISGKRQNESKSFHRRLAKIRGNLGNLEVPPEFQTISESKDSSLIHQSMDGPIISASISTQFYQSNKV